MNKLINQHVGIPANYLVNSTEPIVVNDFDQLVGSGLALLETNTQIIYSDSVHPVILPNEKESPGAAVLT